MTHPAFDRIVRALLNQYGLDFETSVSADWRRRSDLYKEYKQGPGSSFMAADDAAARQIVEEILADEGLLPPPPQTTNEP